MPVSTIESEPSLSVSDELVGNATVVRCIGEIDLATVRHLRDRLGQLQVDGPAQLVLDLDRITFIDSIGLGALIGAHKRARVLRARS